MIFKNCAPFTNSMREINNIQVYDAEDIDIVMAMYNLIEHSDVYSKTAENPQQYFKDEPALDNNNNIIAFLDNNNNIILFKFKRQITEQTRNGGRKDVEIMVPLKLTH